MRVSAIHVAKLDIVPETAPILTSQVETRDSVTIATSQGILRLTVRMTKHARIAAKQATLRVTVRMNLSAMCAIYQGMWRGNAQRVILLVRGVVGVVGVDMVAIVI